MAAGGDSHRHIRVPCEALAPGVKVGADASVVARALEPLLPLFASSHVFKVGVGVQGDVSLLQKFSQNLECRCVRQVCKRVPPCTGATLFELACSLLVA